MVRKLYEQTIVSEFKPHWVPHKSSLVPQQSKAYNKNIVKSSIFTGVMIAYL